MYGRLMKLTISSRVVEAEAWKIYCIFTEGVCVTFIEKIETRQICETKVIIP
jgi:hypothetical protein